jgi:hypothetical protein
MTCEERRFEKFVGSVSPRCVPARCRGIFMSQLLARNALPRLRELLTAFRIVILGGARQTGKTTVVAELLPARAQFSFAGRTRPAGTPRRLSESRRRGARRPWAQGMVRGLRNRRGVTRGAPADGGGALRVRVAQGVAPAGGPDDLRAGYLRCRLRREDGQGNRGEVCSAVRRRLVIWLACATGSASGSR